MQSRPVQSPLLPWEVIERIISHSWDPNDSLWPWWNRASIRNFSLTCRELRPRSLALLVPDAMFYSRDRIFDFCDFLQANPHLKPFVRSITVEPEHFAPIPLLRILPNLPKIEFASLDPAFVSQDLNQSILTSCRLLSTRIQTLCLSDIPFATSLQFFRVLSAFTSIAHFFCYGVLIDKPEEDDVASLYTTKQRLSRRLRLSTLHTCYDPDWYKREKYYDTVSVGSLLVDSGLVRSTLENLTVDVYRSSGLPQKLDWPRLRSLTLNSRSSESKEIAGVIVFLNFSKTPPLPGHPTQDR